MALYADDKGKYQREYDVLWNKLVPRSGKCKTIRGELVRVIGRLASEYYRNGNINWDEDFESHVSFLEKHLLDETPLQLNSKQRSKLAMDIKSIRKNGQTGRCRYLNTEDEYDRVTDRVVEWCNCSRDEKIGAEKAKRNMPGKAEKSGKARSRPE
jgi:hypothetical protein